MKKFFKYFTLALVIAGTYSVSPGILAATNQFNPADGLVIQAWNTDTGLPQNTVNAMVQTRDGYLWLGTRDGLARFDGARFTVFGLQDGLPSIEINALCEDHAGNLWIGTSGGLCRLVNGRIEKLPLPQQRTSSDEIATLLVDANERLWIGTHHGLELFQNGNFVEGTALSALSSAVISSLAQSRDGTIWIGTLEGLFEFHNQQLTEVEGPSDIKSINSHCLLVDHADNLWISIGNGRILRRQSGDWTTYTESNGLPFDYVTCLAQEADGTIWAGSLDVGLYRFDNGYFTKVDQNNDLSADDISSLCPDREGNLWVGTRTGGLNRLSRSKLIVYGTARGLMNDFTRSVAEADDGTLWVGTIGGGLYHGVAGKFTEVPHEVTNATSDFYFAFINSVLATTGNTVWYGGVGGLLRMQDGKLTACYTNDPFLHTTVTALCDDGNGKIWIGLANGRLVYYADGKFTGSSQRVTRGAIASLARQTNGVLWVGSTVNGLKRIESGGVYSVTNGLLSQSIRTIYIDKDNTIWIGTAGGGLSRYQNGKMITFTTWQGLLDDTISQILEDDNGNLWLGCDHGIFRVSKTELNNFAGGKIDFVHPRAYGTSDGMPAEECSGGFCPAGLRTKAGLLCFSTVKGLVLLDPGAHVKALPRTALLEEILVNGQVQPLATNSASLPGVIIPHGAWEVEFHYTAIGLSSPASVRFRYQLTGLDKDWIEVNGRRTAYYHDLHPGHYTFQVAACNADGFWNAQPTKLNVTVEPYFWETLWFQIVAGITILSLIAALMRLAERRRYARLEMLHAVEKERLRISRDIHDDIGGILTQVSQISDLGQGETGLQPKLKEQFERIGRKSRDAVQSLDEIVWATNPKNDNLSRFAEYISRFADEFFENSPIRCWQEVPTDLPDLPLRSSVRHNVFLAMKEAFNNALKHSGATEIRLRLVFNNDRVIIEVEDNGCGFESAADSAGGNGLGNMKTRLEDCKGDAELGSTPGRGVKIRFSFPLSKW